MTGTESPLHPFHLIAADGRRLRGDQLIGQDRQILFITGFLSKRWGNKSKALMEWCQARGWGFACFDFRGVGDSDGRWGDYTLRHWVEDAQAVTRLLRDGPPLTIVGNSLGSWLAWLVAQEQPIVEELILIAPAFNMMRVRAEQIPAERRARWHASGALPWDDDPLHTNWPIAWQWVEDSDALWARTFSPLRRVKTTILHGLQDTVILPNGSWSFVQEVLARDAGFPIQALFPQGDHRLSSAEHLDMLRRAVLRTP